MRTLQNLIAEHTGQERTAVQIHGKLVPARAMRCSCLSCRWQRVKDAWAVLMDKAEAFTYQEGQ